MNIRNGSRTILCICVVILLCVQPASTTIVTAQPTNTTQTINTTTTNTSNTTTTYSLFYNLSQQDTQSNTAFIKVTPSEDENDFFPVPWPTIYIPTLLILIALLGYRTRNYNTQDAQTTQNTQTEQNKPSNEEQEE